MSRKRCQKGKSCGATCISRRKICLVDLGSVGSGLTKVRDSKQMARSSGPPAFEAPSQTLSTRNPANALGVSKVKDTLAIFNNPENKSIEDIDGIVPANKVNWNAGVGKGARYDASGAFGAFVDVPPSSLAKGLDERFPDGVGVKYGKVSKQEARMLQLAGESGAAPRLIAARISPSNRVGMIAMERVPGKTLRKAFSGGEISNETLSDKYLSGMAKLHRAGIFHGDAHLGNAILQPNGEVKMIDFGVFAKASPTKALSEAVGLMTLTFFETGGSLRGESYQRLLSNFDKIKSSGKWSTYNGMRGEGTSKLALEILNELYEGV